MAQIQNVTMKTGPALKAEYVSITVACRVIFSREELGKAFHLAVNIYRQVGSAAPLSAFGRMLPLYTFVFGGAGPVSRERYLTLTGSDKVQELSWSQELHRSKLCPDTQVEDAGGHWGIADHQADIYALVTLAQEAWSPVIHFEYVEITTPHDTRHGALASRAKGV
jgi:hypothetical protein